MLISWINVVQLYHLFVLEVVFHKIEIPQSYSGFIELIHLAIFCELNFFQQINKGLKSWEKLWKFPLRLNFKGRWNQLNNFFLFNTILDSEKSQFSTSIQKFIRILSAFFLIMPFLRKSLIHYLGAQKVNQRDKKKLYITHVSTDEDLTHWV